MEEKETVEFKKIMEIYVSGENFPLLILIHNSTAEVSAPTGTLMMSFSTQRSKPTWPVWPKKRSLGLNERQIATITADLEGIFLTAGLLSVVND